VQPEVAPFGGKAAKIGFRHNPTSPADTEATAEGALVQTIPPPPEPPPPSVSPALETAALKNMSPPLPPLADNCTRVE